MKVSFLSSTGLIIPADAFIKFQPEFFRTSLKKFVDELSVTGNLTGPLAKFIGKGSWEIYVADDSNRLCRFQIQIDGESTGEQRSKLSPTRPSQNGHPVVLKEADRSRPPMGYQEVTDYYEVEEYLGTLNAQEQSALTLTIGMIQKGEVSKNYSALPSGGFLIQVSERGINLKCEIKFV